MRFSSILPVLLCVFLTCCKSSNEIYIVRHAEKAGQPVNDPQLTAEGKRRAELLRDLLNDKKIKGIYSTKTSRTIGTATPLSSIMHIPVENYSADTAARFLQKVVAMKKNALIIGHSNTIIPMLNGLSLPYSIHTIPDSVYNNIFIIKVKEGKPVKIIETSYEALLKKL